MYCFNINMSGRRKENASPSRRGGRETCQKQSKNIVKVKTNECILNTLELTSVHKRLYTSLTELNKPYLIKLCSYQVQEVLLTFLTDC